MIAQQLAPLVFQGSGWLALIRNGAPVAITNAKAFMPAADGHWRPIDEKTAAMYRLTLEVLD